MSGLTSLSAGLAGPLTRRGRVCLSHTVKRSRAAEFELVRRARDGDEDAFAEIVQQHQSMVFSVAMRFVRRPMDAEDVAQQVFTKVFFALKKFNMRSSLSTWIYRIATNESYDYLRRLRSRRVVYQGDLGDEAAEFLETSSRSVDRRPKADAQAARRDLLVRLLEHVSEDDRLLLFRKEVEGLTIRELSRETGVNENTIKVRLFRARKKLVKAAKQRGWGTTGRVS